MINHLRTTRFSECPKYHVCPICTANRNKEGIKDWWSFVKGFYYHLCTGKCSGFKDKSNHRLHSLLGKTRLQKLNLGSSVQDLFPKAFFFKQRLRGGHTVMSTVSYLMGIKRHLANAKCRHDVKEHLVWSPKQISRKKNQRTKAVTYSIIRLFDTGAPVGKVC